jgi:zinc transporter ZupT
MGKHNTVSGILVVIVILTIVASTFMVISYATGVLSAAVAYASSDQVAKLQACGAAPPAALVQFRDDIPSLLLPAMYVGFPGLMVLIAILMFLAGYYHSDGTVGRSSSETTTTTSSPNRKDGKYAPGRHVEETRTQRSSKSEEN